MTKIDTRGRKVNVEDGKQGFQETKRTETTTGVSLTDHYGARLPAQPTRLPKSVIRKALPTKADDDPILVFEHEGQQFWTDRHVMLDVETIAPYVGGLKAAPGKPVEARVKGGALADSGKGMWEGVGDQPCIRLIQNAEDRLARAYGGDKFDVTNPDLIEYYEEDGGEPSYILKTDNEGLTNFKHRLVRVKADNLHLALGTDDLTRVDPDITIAQARNGNGISGTSGYTTLVIMRGDRRVGLVMPMRLPYHLENSGS
ncbi:hypothetical protein [Aeromicrobium sp. 179-A 4D2 NHS]|uniref:hypothetical protein n=1 Tax=Aeromicrobium sp. 179-A 4D2 NHS TaxID=3142375 RepID=UPI00399FAC82